MLEKDLDEYNLQDLTEISDLDCLLQGDLVGLSLIHQPEGKYEPQNFVCVYDSYSSTNKNYQFLVFRGGEQIRYISVFSMKFFHVLSFEKQYLRIDAESIGIKSITKENLELYTKKEIILLNVGL
jgi:hypothetical protein